MPELELGVPRGSVTGHFFPRVSNFKFQISTTPQRLGEQQRLAAGGAAEVGDGFTGFHVEHGGGEERGGILDVVVAAPKLGGGEEGTGIGDFENAGTRGEVGGKQRTEDGGRGRR